jgi:hypothetical protein
MSLSGGAICGFDKKQLKVVRVTGMQKDRFGSLKARVFILGIWRRRRSR